MRKQPIRFAYLLGMLASLLAVPALSQDERQPEKPVVQKLSDGVYQIGTVQLDKNTQEIRLPGRVNMQEGLIELFACGPKGKLHESVLVLDIIPYHMQVALLLLGLEPGGGLAHQGDPDTPTGDPVEIWVEWDHSDSLSSSPMVRRHRAEELIYNIAREQPMQQTHWVFVGSKIVDGWFMAQVEQSLVTTYHNPYTILDNPSPSGGDDTLYIVNKEIVPEVGTPVQMIIKAVEQTEQ